MRPIYSAGAIASVLFTAAGLYWLWKLGLLGTGLSICLLGLACGPALGLGLYALQLRQSISRIEKQLQELK